MGGAVAWLGGRVRSQPIGRVNIHLGRVNIHLGRVNIHLGRVNIHLGRVNIHLGRVNIHKNKGNTHRACDTLAHRGARRRRHELHPATHTEG